ncbi:MAG: hypothetical protein ACE5I5_00580 [Candidatus Heimdallarchaeota archaeon]
MVLEFLRPVNLEMFVGRDEIINSFREAMRNYKKNSVEKKGWVIVGDPGSGRTSMINILERIVRTEGLTPIIWSVPLDYEMWEIPKWILESLKDRLTLKKKKNFEKIPFHYSTNLTLEDTSYSAIINTMCEKFALINEELVTKREYIVYLFDDVERFFLLGQENLFLFMLDILTNFTERNFKTFFVFAITTEFWKQVQKDLKDLSIIIELERLDLKEAEVLLQRRVDPTYRIDPQVVREITKQTDRSPFSLVYALTLLKEMKEEDESEISTKIWDRVAPQLREINSDVLGINESESKILSLFAGRTENLLRKQEIERLTGIENARLSPLLREMEEKGLIVQGKAFIQIASNALHQLLRQKLVTGNILAMIHALFDQVEFELNNELKPSIQLIERIENLSESLDKAETSRKYLYDLGSRAELLAKHSFSKEFWYEAYAFAQLASNFFANLALDPERGAITAEDIGKIFFDQTRMKSSLLHYAIKLYTYATKMYKKAKIDWKVKSNAREAAILYEQLGDQYKENNMLGIARSQYYEAAQYFKLAKEPTRQESVIQKGKKVSKSPELSLLFEK